MYPKKWTRIFKVKDGDLQMPGPEAISGPTELRLIAKDAGIDMRSQVSGG